MKRFLFFVLVLFFQNLFFLPAQEEISELEFLWKKSRDYDALLHSKQNELNYASFAYKNKKSLYPFSLSSDFSSSYNDYYYSVMDKPVSSSISATLSKSNPGGQTIKTKVGYDFSRGFFSTKSVDEDNVGFYHNPNITVSFEQSLNSYIVQGYKKDPNTEVLRTNILVSEGDKYVYDESLITKVNEYYITYRVNSRLKEKTDLILDFYDKKINALNEKIAKGQASYSDLWKIENEKWETFEDNIEYLNAKENALLNLKSLCGFIQNPLTTSALPDANIPLNEKNYEKENLLLSLEQLELNYVLSKQKYSPVLVVQGSFSEDTNLAKYYVNFVDDKLLLDWGFSVGLKFSEFFSPSKDLVSLQYKNNVNYAIEKLALLDEKNKNEKINYDDIIKTYENQILSMKDLIINKEKTEKDYKLLFENGKCSFLDYESAKVSLQESVSTFENLNDYLWLYKWKRSQCK